MSLLQNMPATRLSFATTGKNLLMDLQAEMRIVEIQKDYLFNLKNEILDKLKINSYNYKLLEELRDTLDGLASLGYPQPTKIKNNEIYYRNYVIDHIDMVGA